MTGPDHGAWPTTNEEVRPTMADRKLILSKPASRRTMLKGAAGAAAGFCATGLVGKSYRRARAQDDVLAQILAIPGAGLQPSESDMERVGELVLRSDKQGAFQGQTVTFIGLNNAGYQTTSSALFRALGRSTPAPRSSGSTCPRPRSSPRSSKAWPPERSSST